MYAALINYPVKHGDLEEAVKAWREGEKTMPKGSQATRVLCSSSSRIGPSWLLSGIPNLRDDAFATGPWREGSEFRNKIDVVLSEEPTREEFKVGFLNVGAIL